MSNLYNNKSQCKVISDFKPWHDDILIVRKGELLSIKKNTNRHWSGWKYCINHLDEGGWVPERYLRINGESAVILRDYTYKELAIHKNENLAIEREISGWLLCLNNNGERGWVPLNNVERMEQ